MIGSSPQLGIKLFQNQVNYARILLLGSPNVNNFKTNPSSHEVNYSWCIFGLSFNQFGSRGIFYFSQSCHLPAQKGIIFYFSQKAIKIYRVAADLSGRSGYRKHEYVFVTPEFLTDIEHTPIEDQTSQFGSIIICV